MRRILKIGTLLVISSLLLLAACDDDGTEPPVDPMGTLDFSRYIAIGNSLTAGYQSGALLSDGQNNSYPNLITKQVDATDADGSYTMTQPLIDYPGISVADGGVLELTFVNGNPIVARSTLTQPTSSTVEAPYHNLGVPGAYSTDVTVATSGANWWLAPIDIPNPFFDLVVQGKTQAAIMTEAQPSFVTMWIGNNDVLGYALRGGDVLPQIENIVLTDDGTFESAWIAAADAIDATGAKAIVANIPNVTDIPHFTTVPFEVDVPIVAGGTVTVPLQYIDDGVTVAATSADLILLVASSLIGVPDSDGNLMGISNQNPLPDALVLDVAEQAKVAVKIAHHNSFIATQAAARGYGIVDFNAIFSDIAANGLTVGSETFTTDYITGNIFSLDGVHPTGKGYGIVANEFLKVIDVMFDADITKVNVSTLPGVPVATLSKLTLNPYTKTPIFATDAFDGMYRMFGVTRNY